MFLPLILATAVNWAEAPPVPGQCSAPAAENVGKPGCFLTAELQIEAAPAALWWHVYEFPTVEAASEAASKHRWATTASSHGRVWVHVLGQVDARVQGGQKRAVVGPVEVPPGRVTARFLESVFTPGMRTRVHSHAGPEAFYVIDGAQCVETPAEKRKLQAGDTLIVPPGPHVQAAAAGRRNLTLVLSPAGAPWMKLESAWTPSQFCAS